MSSCGAVSTEEASVADGTVVAAGGIGQLTSCVLTDSSEKLLPSMTHVRLEAV